LRYLFGKDVFLPMLPAFRIAMVTFSNDELKLDTYLPNDSDLTEKIQDALASNNMQKEDVDKLSIDKWLELLSMWVNKNTLVLSGQRLFQDDFPGEVTKLLVASLGICNPKKQLGEEARMQLYNTDNPGPSVDQRAKMSSHPASFGEAPKAVYPLEDAEVRLRELISTGIKDTHGDCLPISYVYFSYFATVGNFELGAVEWPNMGKARMNYKNAHRQMTQLCNNDCNIEEETSLIPVAKKGKDTTLATGGPPMFGTAKSHENVAHQIYLLAFYNAIIGAPFSDALQDTVYPLVKHKTLSSALKIIGKQTDMLTPAFLTKDCGFTVAMKDLKIATRKKTKKMPSVYKLYENKQ